MYVVYVLYSIRVLILNDLIDKKGNFINLGTLDPDEVIISWLGNQVEIKSKYQSRTLCEVPIFSLGVPCPNDFEPSHGDVETEAIRAGRKSEYTMNDFWAAEA